MPSHSDRQARAANVNQGKFKFEIRSAKLETNANKGRPGNRQTTFPTMDSRLAFPPIAVCFVLRISDFGFPLLTIGGLKRLCSGEPNLEVGREDP